MSGYVGFCGSLPVPVDAPKHYFHPRPPPSIPARRLLSGPGIGPNPRVHAILSTNHDDAHVGILTECLKDRGNLTATAIGRNIQRRPIQAKKADLLLWIDFVVQTIEIA